MAINIFQGSSAKSSKSVNSAKNSTRAQQAKAALAEPAQVSNSGSTAVGSNGTLSKVGNFIGTAANIASKFLPGLGGTIAGAVGNMLNDPEWWQSIPGEAVTLNVALSLTGQDSVALRHYDSLGTLVKEFDHAVLRPTIGEFVSGSPSDAQLNAPALYSGLTYGDYVIFPSEAAITQYLIPEIRRVVNAVPLQTAATYRIVLQTNATVYALWQQLKKVRFLLENGKTYIPNMDNVLFPICQVANHEKLMAFINRLEEYLRSHVRLPHTLCEYLAWRYGRIYLSNSAVKSGLIMYNVVPLDSSISTIENFIGELLQVTSSSTYYQQAASDLYNAYFDHDSWVEIRDDTQFKFDTKEFALRTNCDVIPKVQNAQTFTLSDSTTFDLESDVDDDPNPVYIDSSLDNPTAFMASTMSTLGKDNNTYVCLFPVKALHAYYHNFSSTSADPCIIVPYVKNDQTAGQARVHLIDFGLNHNWAKVAYVRTESTDSWNFKNVGGSTITDYGIENPDYYAIMVDLAICKPLDIYNKNVNVLATNSAGNGSYYAFDITSLAADMGLVSGQVLAVEHIYAFANMTYSGRKTSTSYGTAEKLVSRDVANFVEKLDISQAKS